MLTSKTIRGAGWSVLARLSGRMMDVVTYFVLARVLSPADFGLAALGMTVIAIAETVLEIPLIQALTRLRDIERAHLDTAFTLGVARSAVLTTIILLAAEPFAAVYEHPQLVPLVIVLAAGPMARGLYSPGMVSFIRDLNFQPVFAVEFIGKISASALALAIVYFGGGYWAIVANNVAASVISSVASYIIAPYRPRFGLSKMSDFTSFAGWFSFSQIISAFNWQFDRILVGRFVPPGALGQYTLASDIAVLPTQSLLGPAMQPVMAAFSKINNDRERLRNAFLKASFFTMLIAMPTCVGMAVTGDLIFKLFLDAKWTDAPTYFCYLAPFVALNAYVQPLYSMALAVSRPQLIFRLNLVDITIRCILIPLGFYYYSILGVIAARGALSTVMFVIMMFSARVLVGTSVVTQLANLSKIFVATGAMAAAVLTFRHYADQIAMHPLPALILSIACGAAVYTGVLLALGLRLSAVRAFRSV